MKYIRTKDGIFENKPLEKHLGNRRGKGYEITFRQEEIIKQADTIEELCDEFVIWFKELDKPTQFRDFEIAKKYIKAKVYGAVWTNKGLIYVAKMNDKGELELL